MADTPVNLHALALVAIQAATTKLASGGSVQAWTADMERILARAHTAAAIAGIAERAGVKPNDGLFKGLSKAERAEVKAAVKTQLDYLKGFAAAVKAGQLSSAQVAARAALYAGATRATYYGQRYPGLPFYPTQGSECMANCKCSWEPEDATTYHWTLHTAEHCPTCERRASNNPYRLEAA